MINFPRWITAPAYAWQQLPFLVRFAVMVQAAMIAAGVVLG